jgi:hypothetical protein
MAMSDGLKEWKLAQATLGLVALIGISIGVKTGRIQAKDWVPIASTPTPDTIVFHLEAMRQAYQKDNFVVALAEAERVRRTRTDLLEVNRIRALCFLKLGRFDEARLVLNQLLTLNPRDMQVKLALALALRSTGKIEQGTAILLQIVKSQYATDQQKEIARQSLFGLLGEPPAPRPFLTPAPFVAPSPLPSISMTPTPILAAIKVPPLGKIPSVGAALIVSPKPARQSVEPITIELRTPSPSTTHSPLPTPEATSESEIAPLEIPAPAEKPPSLEKPLLVEKPILPATAPKIATNAAPKLKKKKSVAKVKKGSTAKKTAL